MKKYLRPFVVTFAFILAFFGSKAQVPGFIGKHITAGFNTSSFLIFPLQGDFVSSLMAPKIANKFEFNAGFTISRKVTVCFSYYTDTQHYLFHYHDFANGFHYVEDNDRRLPFKLHMYELAFKVFRKNFIAPVGLYTQYAVALVNYGIAESDSLELVGNNGYGGSAVFSIKTNNDPFACFKLSFHIGKITPLGKLFYLNAAMGLNYFTGGDMGNIPNPSDQNFILSNVNRNLKVQNMLEVKIGLGWFAI